MAGEFTVRDLLIRRHGVRFTTEENRVASSVGTTAAEIFRQDPSRVGFLFVNLSLNRIYLRPRGDPTTSLGIRVDPNGGSLSVDWERDGEVVGWEWRGLADGASSAFIALEILVASEA